MAADCLLYLPVIRPVSGTHWHTARRCTSVPDRGLLATFDCCHASTNRKDPAHECVRCLRGAGDERVATTGRVTRRSDSTRKKPGDHKPVRVAMGMKREEEEEGCLK